MANEVMVPVVLAVIVGCTLVGAAIVFGMGVL